MTATRKMCGEWVSWGIWAVVCQCLTALWKKNISADWKISERWKPLSQDIAWVLRGLQLWQTEEEGGKIVCPQQESDFGVKRLIENIRINRSKPLYCWAQKKRCAQTRKPLAAINEVLLYEAVNFTREARSLTSHWAVAVCLPCTWEELKLWPLMCSGLSQMVAPHRFTLVFFYSSWSFLCYANGIWRWHLEQDRLLQSKGVLWEFQCPASALVCVLLLFCLCTTKASISKWWLSVPCWEKKRCQMGHFGVR